MILNVPFYRDMTEPKSEKKEPLSRCCNAPVDVACGSDFIGDSDGVTMWNECSKCNQACDVK